MNNEKVPCKWCGIQTYSTGTKECDGCWELRWRISSQPELAEKMLKALKEEKLNLSRSDSNGSM